MSRLHWPYRRELVLGDLLLVGTLAGLAITRLVEGPGHLGSRPFALVPITYLVVCMHLIAWLSGPAGQGNHWFFVQVAKRLSDLALGLVLLVGAMVLVTGPGLEFTQPTTFLGIPSDMVPLVVGVAGLVIGWVWIRRIARGEPVPEANDRFWRSRG
jgi:hypothetical protein